MEISISFSIFEMTHWKFFSLSKSSTLDSKHLVITQTIIIIIQ
jgi:hypothetical protein